MNPPLMLNLLRKSFNAGHSLELGLFRNGRRLWGGGGGEIVSPKYFILENEITFEKTTILVKWSKLLTGVRKIMLLCRAALNLENEFYCLQISNPQICF